MDFSNTLIGAGQIRILKTLDLRVPDHEDVHLVVEDRQLLEQCAPEAQSADVAFAVAAECLLD